MTRPELEYRFEWDPNKDLKNRMKHGVSFDEAQTAFDDPNAIYIEDVEHSIDEERFQLIGYSEKLRILFVCYCNRNSDIVRIISARRATKTERDFYFQGGVQ